MGGDHNLCPWFYPPGRSPNLSSWGSVDASLQVQLITSLAIGDWTQSPAGAQGWDPKYKPSNHGVGSPDNQPPSLGYLGAFQKPLRNSEKHLYNAHLAKSKGFQCREGGKTKQYPHLNHSITGIEGRSLLLLPALSADRESRPRPSGAGRCVREPLPCPTGR